MEISVRQTNINPKLIRQLLANGIILVSHLNKFDTARLARKTRLCVADCEQILTAIKPKRPHYVMRASELLIKPFEKISTLIDGLDSILGGGIKCGHITEVSGEAGAGKSNLCSQMSGLVMRPKDENGLDGHVLYIHTEGEGKLKLAIKRFTALASTELMRNLHVVSCSSDVELTEMINRLPEMIMEIPNVKLIVIDSITCAFIEMDRCQNGKTDFEYYDRRALRLTKIIKLLAQLAWDRRVAVIATNHVSYNFKFGQNRPALGKTWSHMCQTKIYLERSDDARFAHVTKGAATVPVPVHFRITN